MPSPFIPDELQHEQIKIRIYSHNQADVTAIANLIQTILPTSTRYRYQFNGYFFMLIYIPRDKIPPRRPLKPWTIYPSQPPSSRQYF